MTLQTQICAIILCSVPFQLFCRGKCCCAYLHKFMLGKLKQTHLAYVVIPNYEFNRTNMLIKGKFVNIKLAFIFANNVFWIAEKTLECLSLSEISYTIYIWNIQSFAHRIVLSSFMYPLSTLCCLKYCCLVSASALIKPNILMGGIQMSEIGNPPSQIFVDSEEPRSLLSSL